MKKYRIRLKNDRVVGPFDENQIKELKIKGRVDGTEDVQLFPTGDWHNFAKFDELKYITDVETEVNEDATFIRKINLEELKDEAEKTSVEAFPKKFEYEKRTPFLDRAIDETQNEASINIQEVAPVQEEKQKTKLSERSKQKNSVKEIKLSVDEPAEDKTLVNVDTKKYLDELKKEKEKQDKEEKEIEEQKVPEIDIDNDSTQFIDISSLKQELKENISENEKEFLDEKKGFEDEKAELEKSIKEAKLLREKEDEEENDEDDDSGKKKKKLLIIVGALALLLVLFFPEEEPKNQVKKIVLKEPLISFPVRFDIKDEKKALDWYKKGLILEKKGRYLDYIKSSVAYKKSVENQFNNNKASAKMIFLYSLLLENSNDKENDANTIFKLVQIYKNKTLQDADFCSAMALFYIRTKKYNAAVNTIDKFLTIKKSKPSVELFAVYLQGLSLVGDLVKAKAVSRKIETVPVEKLSLFSMLRLIEYYKIIGNLEKVTEIVEKGRKVYKKSAALNLERANLLFYKEDYKSLDKLLGQLRTINLEGSKIYYSKYLEYRGLLAVKSNSVKKAKGYFEKALKTYESLELRSRLASLYEEGVSGTEYSMIAESKALQLISSSQTHVKENNWKFAFKDALEASRIATNFIPAKIYLTKLQIKQSIFKEAIDTLEELYKVNPRNPEIVFTLVDAYIESYKFGKVRKILTILNTSELRNNPNYTSLTAKFYIYKNDFINAESWLRRAINKNPLNDENLYELAKMYIKYNKFNKAKLTLNKAMDLDPAKIEYRIAYSKILYEVDGSDSGIGYLYDVLQDFPDNAKLLSQIGIYYYRSGQIKSYESIKTKLTEIPNKDTTLYHFLIEAAKLDDKPRDEIKYSKKLIEINPGDLETRLSLGKIYMGQEKYKNALVEFKAIEDRLDTYPSLQLYMSNLYLLTDNKDKAIELANKEIKANSSSELGYILLGDIYSAKKEYLEAEKYYKKAQRINGDNVDMLLGLAKINFKKSQYDLTIDLFLKAREISPERAEVHKLLGDSYRKMGQSTLAMESYKLFLELSPSSKYKDEIETYLRKMQ